MMGAIAPWARLRKVLDANPSDETEAEGAAALHSRAAREEAARKLILNHDAVLMDVTNPHPRTQWEFARVGGEAVPYADQALREVARRLLGRRKGACADEYACLEEKLLPSMSGVQLSAWAAVAKFLDKRIQSLPGEVPGRNPDMSPAAAAAMRAVLREVAHWVPLAVLLTLPELPPSAAVCDEVGGYGPAGCPGATGDVGLGFDPNKSSRKRQASGDIREEWQIREHEETQDSLIAGPLVGFGGMVIDSGVDDKKGGKAAGKRAAAESAASDGARAASEPREGGARVSDEEKAAREQAAIALISNHEAVLLDVTDPNPSTQLELERVGGALMAPETLHFVDQALRETCRRLLGRRPGSHLLEQKLDLSMPTQLIVWAQTAEFIGRRIQCLPSEMPGRTPDLSPPAAAALRAALNEVGQVGHFATGAIAFMGFAPSNVQSEAAHIPLSVTHPLRMRPMHPLSLYQRSNHSSRSLDRERLSRSSASNATSYHSFCGAPVSPSYTPPVAGPRGGSSASSACSSSHTSSTVPPPVTASDPSHPGRSSVLTTHAGSAPPSPEHDEMRDGIGGMRGNSVKGSNSTDSQQSEVSIESVIDLTPTRNSDESTSHQPRHLALHAHHPPKPPPASVAAAALEARRQALRLTHGDLVDFFKR